ncbi:MAG TPA: hypothetical protein VHQ03_01570, partial [Candidatus Dormibacteraeota bacterium]|nr:hypothetical protein [Candidatus Dormibacteraeota bacterium]
VPAQAHRFLASGWLNGHLVDTSINGALTPVLHRRLKTPELGPEDRVPNSKLALRCPIKKHRNGASAAGR